MDVHPWGAEASPLTPLAAPLGRDLVDDEVEVGGPVVLAALPNLVVLHRRHQSPGEVQRRLRAARDERAQLGVLEPGAATALDLAHRRQALLLLVAAAHLRPPGLRHCLGDVTSRGHLHSKAGDVKVLSTT